MCVCVYSDGAPTYFDNNKGIFVRAISHAKNLRTIVGTENHTQHGPRVSLTPDNVECFMGAVPTLKTIIDGNRIWTVSVICLRFSFVEPPKLT